MAQRIQLRRGTAAEWAATNPVLAVGEPGVETDTGKQKLGDGVTAWNSRPYASKGDKGDQGTPGVADDASVAALFSNPNSQTRAAGNATYVPRWKANTAYAAGDKVVSPEGVTVTAKAAFTSGAAYSATNWDLPASLAGKLDSAAATTTYAPMRALPIGNRWVSLGDSITAGFITGAAADRWQVYLSLITQGRFYLLKNAGVGGNTSAQARARINTDVIPYAPQGCTVMIGTNDIITGVSITTWQANVQGIVGDLRAAGIAPVLCTLVPMSNSQKSGAVAQVQTWNVWLRRYAASQGIPLIDFYSILADTTTGDWKTGYSLDGVHPQSVPLAAMGRYAAGVLDPHLPPLRLPISESNGDTSNMQPNPMFVDANSDGFPDSWTKLQAGGTGTISYAMVDDPKIRGRWSEVTASGYSLNAGWGTYQANKISTWAAGDKIAVACYVQIPSIAAGGSYYLYASGYQPESDFAKNLTQPLPEVCMYYVETTLTSTTANLGFDANIRGGTGVMRIAQPTVYNLTKMGIA